MHSFSEMLQRNSLLRVNFHRYLLKLLILLFYCQISYLGIVGGRSEEDTVERVLSATISNDLARMFNWNGLKGKRCFRKLQLTKVVFGMVIRCIAFSSINDLVNICCVVPLMCNSLHCFQQTF